LKIIFVIKGLKTAGGGAERGLVDIANYLADLQWEITILNLDLYRRKNANIFYRTSPSIKLIDIFIDQPNILRRFFNSSINKLHSILNRKGSFYFSNRQVIKELKSLIQLHEPDIVASFMPSSFIQVAQALKNTNIPFLISHQNDPFHHPSYTNLKKEIFEAARLATINTVFHDKFKNYFSYEIQKKTVTIPNRVFLADKKNYANPDISNGKKIIISTGRMVPQKNHELLIKGFALIAREYPDWDVKIFGRSTLKNYLDNLIAENHLSGRVILLDTVKNIFEELSRSHIYAFPSIFEGWGLGLTEAMAHGLPSIVLKECIPPSELVLDSNGGVVANNDPADFAQKLKYLITHPQKRKEMGLNAQKFVSNYHHDKIHSKWLEVIYSTIEKNKQLQKQV